MRSGKIHLTDFESYALIPQYLEQLHELNRRASAIKTKSTGMSIREEDLSFLLNTMIDNVENSVFSDDCFSMSEQTLIYGLLMEFQNMNLQGVSKIPGESPLADIRSDLQDAVIQANPKKMFMDLVHFMESHGLFIDM